MAKNGNKKGGSPKRNPSTRAPQKKKSGYTGLIVGAVILIVLLVFYSIAMFNNSSSQNANQRQAPAANMPTIDGMTCDSMEGSVFHIHSHLAILNNGENVEVPANIGIYPNNVPSCLYWLHTHDNTGELHMEAPKTRTFTLGNFFNVWKQPLSKTQVMNYTSKGQEIKAYVDGKEFTGDPSTIELKSHTQVVLEVGPKFVPPPTTYTFPQGD
ncbi:MAG: hypothetical protein ACXVDJ_09940 [Tumebacillaceae bacterium]